MVLVTPSPDADEVTPDGTKKKKLTSSLDSKDGQRRLVEYLVVVSSVPQLDDDDSAEKKSPTGEEWTLSTSFDDEDIVVQYSFKPEITARYPLHDHSDNPLHENVTFFCHPSGAIHLKKQHHLPKVSIWNPFRSPFQKRKPCMASFWRITCSPFSHLTFCPCL